LIWLQRISFSTASLILLLLCFLITFFLSIDIDILLWMNRSLYNDLEWRT
jgi:hypothetical protein